MKDTITVQENNAKKEVSVFESNGTTIKHVPKRFKDAKTGRWFTEWVDIRTLKVGDMINEAIVVENPYL